MLAVITVLNPFPPSSVFSNKIHTADIKTAIWLSFNIQIRKHPGEGKRNDHKSMRIEEPAGDWCHGVIFVRFLVTLVSASSGVHYTNTSNILKGFCSSDRGREEGMVTNHNKVKKKKYFFQPSSQIYNIREGDLIAESAREKMAISISAR